MKREQTVLFKKWFEKLASNVQDKIVTYIDRVFAGNTANCKSIASGVYEIKINYQKGYRVYFTFLNGRAILLLLCGGDKKTQPDDIKQAIKVKKYLEAKNEK